MEEREQRRWRRLKEKGLMRSSIVRWKQRHKSCYRRFKRILQKSIKTVVDHYIIDNMKSPNSNRAMPALFAPTSFDIYFGMNRQHPTCQTILRTAYATGSGVTSIGLDPRHARINHMFPSLNDLTQISNK